mgnify:CR=1 FL=1
MEQREGLLQDTHFWVLLASIGFVIVLLKYARKPLLAMLDARTAKIKAQLDAERSAVSTLPVDAAPEPASTMGMAGVT